MFFSSPVCDHWTLFFYCYPITIISHHRHQLLFFEDLNAWRCCYPVTSILYLHQLFVEDFIAGIHWLVMNNFTTSLYHYLLGTVVYTNCTFDHIPKFTRGNIYMMNKSNSPKITPIPVVTRSNPTTTSKMSKVSTSESTPLSAEKFRVAFTEIQNAQN